MSAPMTIERLKRHRLQLINLKVNKGTYNILARRHTGETYDEMVLTSKTGLMASTTARIGTVTEEPEQLQLCCEVTPAPFMLRPYAGIFSPFSPGCSVLCNHPATDTHLRDVVNYAKRSHDGKRLDGDRHKMSFDIVTEDMFRRYAETDSRPLTPAPTVASGKSRGSRRCMTPDQPAHRASIVVDLRRSHSQETIHYHGYGSEPAAGAAAKKAHSSQLPPLACPLVLNKRSLPPREAAALKSNLRRTKILAFKAKLQRHQPRPRDGGKNFYVTGDNLPALKPRARRRPLKLPPLAPSCDCNLKHVSRVYVRHAPRSRKRVASNNSSRAALGTPGKLKRIKLMVYKPPAPTTRERLTYDCDEFFRRLETQLKALNLGKPTRGKNKETTSKDDAESKTTGTADDGGGDGGERRRGKRRRRARGSDRLTSAGLAPHQDPETQIAGISTDSREPSSRGSACPPDEELPPPPARRAAPRHADSFLSDDLLKLLHREVDEEAIHTEFDTKRRYVLQEAFRTRPHRPRGEEMHALLREMKDCSMSLGDWLHVPRVFSRRNAAFSLPLHSQGLEALTPMKYAARYAVPKKSKQLLYLTVVRKYRPGGYRIPIDLLKEALVVMMGGSLATEQAEEFAELMEWEGYIDEEEFEDDIKLVLPDTMKNAAGDGDIDNSLKFRTWCGVCAICERMYGRFPPLAKDPPEGLELSDFFAIETKLNMLNIHSGLVKILKTIKSR